MWANNTDEMSLTNYAYMDYASTTPVDPRVIDTMQPYYEMCFGNASSLHRYGTMAKSALEWSRETLSQYIGAPPTELIFTSGGTEANNMAIKGVALANRQKGNHIIVSAIEHDCVLNTCKWLEEQGFYITTLPVSESGVVKVEELRKMITSQTILVSVMIANNELGTIQPVERIGAICREHDVLFHADGCQAFGKIMIDVNRQSIDLLSINAHKIYGPKGIGALYVKKGTTITPLLHGGGQENGLRSTTENIPAIVGFAKAAELCMHEMNDETARLSKLRDEIITFLKNGYENVYINGEGASRLPGYLNFSFQGQEGETIRLLLLLDQMGIAVSAGSACSSNHGGGASHVLQAIGLNPFEARGGIRVTLGRFTTPAHVKKLCDAMEATVTQMNSIFS
jgi:cysteine desulfurase